MLDKFPFVHPLVDTLLYGVGCVSVILGFADALIDLGFVPSALETILFGIGLLLIASMTRLVAIANLLLNVNTILRGIIAGPKADSISLGDYERIRRRMGIHPE